MSMKTALITSTALAALALPAQAEISPDEAWSMMQTYYANAGMTVTAQRSEEGDDVILRDVEMTMPRDTGDVVLSIPEIRLERDGDGVAYSMAEKMTAKLPHTSPDGVEGASEIVITQKDLDAKITGEAGDMNIDFDVAEIAVEVGNVTMSGEAIPMVIRVALTDMSGTEHVKTDGDMAVTSDFEIGKITYSIAGAAGGDAQGTMNGRGEIKDTKATFEMLTPAGVSTADLPDALGKGFKVKGDVKVGAGTSNFTMSGMEGGDMSSSSSAQTGQISFAIDATGARYEAGSTGMMLDQTNPMLPFPIHVEIASGSGGVQIPMVPMAETSPVGIELRLEDLTVNDEIWAMFDPTGQLPHSPATVILDLEGMGKLTSDLTKASELPPGQMPFELETAVLKELKIMLLGADLTGTGAMKMDNSGPMPIPSGAVDLRLVGGNALIDKLVATGLLPAEQLMGVRMMLGLFTVPAGDDVMTSKIEMREDGGVYANGQRLQ